MAQSTEAFRTFERAGWEDAGLAEGYDSHLARVTRQSVPALLDAANVAAGRDLLDVATGAGHVVAAALERGARATGLDFSATQVELARGRVPQARFLRGDAEDLPFEHAAFDALTCAFGICHFPQPDGALREAFRVLRPGGRVAFTVWGLPDQCLGLGIVYDAIRQHGALQVGLPEGPNFFLFSEPATSVAALERAGFTEVQAHLVPQTWPLPDADALFRCVASGTVRTAAVLAAQSEQALAAIRGAMRGQVEALAGSGPIALPMPALLASGTRP